MNGGGAEIPRGSGGSAPYAVSGPSDPDPAGTRVSVITRTRNRREMLREAAASVAAQDYRPVELVVVNDGGAGVADILDPLRSSLDVVLVESASAGRCRAGNLGLEASSGTWIAWLDDDDVYLPRHLSTLRRALDASGAKVAYTDAYRVEQIRSPSGGWVESARSVPWSEDFSRVMMFRQSYIHLVTVMHHRECFLRLGGFDPRLEVLEDWDMFFRFAQDYDFHHVKATTAEFRIRDDGTNAVTAMRREFAETRTLLFSRYAHLAMPEILNQLERGVGEIASLHARIAAIEERMRRMEEDR